MPAGYAPFDRLSRKVIGALFDDRLRHHHHLVEVFKRHNAEVRRRIGPR